MLLTQTLSIRGRSPTMVTKCETFSCPNEAIRPYSIAPATVVKLCEDCIKEAEEAAGGKYDANNDTWEDGEW